MRKILPKAYEAKLSFVETEEAIKAIKGWMMMELEERLELMRVSAPMMVKGGHGINDDLNGVERKVTFDGKEVAGEVVQSLAKWKRLALWKYDLSGLYTDMNAIRMDETLDYCHSIYVDQWDWEKVITQEERTMETLVEAARKIYQGIRAIKQKLVMTYPGLVDHLPEDLMVVDSETLEDMYVEMSPKEREDAICKKLGAVLITRIGGPLKNGKPHDLRAPDYDDWTLNGDLLVWDPIWESALELSSMGIRVDASALGHQLKMADAMERKDLYYHKLLLEGRLPLTMGGGLGQSRLCQFLLEKAHIGEVQASIWDEETERVCQQRGILLL